MINEQWSQVTPQSSLWASSDDLIAQAQEREQERRQRDANPWKQTVGVKK